MSEYDPQYVVASRVAHLVRLGTNHPARFLCGTPHLGADMPRRGEPVCQACSRIAAKIDKVTP